MRTLISVASVCTLFVLAASNAACSRTTHTSVSDKSQPNTTRPDTDMSGRDSTTAPSSKYPGDLPGDTGLRHDTTTNPNSTTPNHNNSTFPQHDTKTSTQKSNDVSKSGSGMQPPESTDSGQRDSDKKLEAQVRSAIAADSTVASNADTITVICRSGVATLQGNVKDQEQKDAIVLAVQRVNGVERVDDQLTLPRN